MTVSAPSPLTTDLVIMRHKGQNMAERAAWLLNTHTYRPVPVINGGSGSDQHPTQALLDVFTLQQSFEYQGGLDGKTILMCWRSKKRKNGEVPHLSHEELPGYEDHLCRARRLSDERGCVQLPRKARYFLPH